MLKPLNNKIQLQINEVKIGAIMSDSIEEHGTVIDVGPSVGTHVKGGLIGKTLYFKAWACDVITIEDKKYYFISADSDAICAISDNKEHQNIY